MNKIAVSLYLYYTDLWPDFYELLYPLKAHIKLYITLSYDTLDGFDLKALDHFNHQIFYHNNYGADIAPFLNQLHSISEPVFIKLHSKKSSWGFKRHINWRELLLYNLIGSSSIFHNNMIKMNDTNNGILCSNGLLFNDRELKNSEHIKKICSITNIDYDTVKNGSFVAGNMFWGRTALFQKMFNNYIDDINSLLIHETGKINDDFYGTYCHAMERIFGYIVSYNDMNFIYADIPTIKVINSSAPNGEHFHLVTTHKNSCYLLEDPNVYGHIKHVSKNKIEIQWSHLAKSRVQHYAIIDSMSIQKIL